MSPEFWIAMGKAFALCIGVSLIGVACGYFLAWVMGPTGEGD